MQRIIVWVGAATLLASAGTAAAQSNIDAAHKYAWGENIGWADWRDANGAVDGVIVDGTNHCLSGYIWCENVGWLDVGDGGCPYGNTTGLDFGVNIEPNGDLSGYGWGENIGWVNFDTRTHAPDQARYEAGASRLRGYVWGENVGWVNLDDATHFIATIVSVRAPSPELGGPGCEAGLKFCHDLAGGGTATPCSTDADCSPGEFCWDDCWGDWRGANCIVYNHVTGAARCYIPKNRYLTIDPTVNDEAVSYHVTLVQADSQYDQSCLPVEGWLTAPVCRDKDFGCPQDPQPGATDPCQDTGPIGRKDFGWVSYISPDPQPTRLWEEYPLFVTGCMVGPAVTFEVRASADGVTPVDPPLIMATTRNPSGTTQQWGDVGSSPGTTVPWMPAENAMNMADVSLVIKTFEAGPNPPVALGGPRLEWSDLKIDHVVNFDDVQVAVFAFAGDTYPQVFDVTGGCGSEPARPLIGHEPCECP